MKMCSELPNKSLKKGNKSLKKGNKSLKKGNPCYKDSRHDATVTFAYFLFECADFC